MNKNLGLAYVAKKLVIGTEKTVELIRKQRVYLVLLANDASELTKKKILDKARFYNVEVSQTMSSNQLSLSIGKKGVKVIGVTDRGFSRLLSQ